MAYRRAAKWTRSLPATLVDEIGGLETHLGTPHIAAFILARAGVVDARAQRANAKSDEVKYENGLRVERREGTFIKAIESFVADWWTRMLKRAPVKGGSRQRDKRFRKLYDRFYKTVCRKMRDDGDLSHLLEDLGPARPSENKVVRDFHGRRFEADPRLAEYESGAPPLGVVQCAGEDIQRKVLQGSKKSNIE